MKTKCPLEVLFVTLFATVSIDKLVSFAESKGMEAELKGGLFAMNIKKMEFDKMAEEKAVENLCKQLETMLPTLFDYEISVDEPKQDDYHGKYFVGFSIKAKSNKSNMEQFMRTLFTTLGKISLNLEEVSSYKNLNRKYYPIMLYDIVSSLIGSYGRNVHPIGIQIIGDHVYSKQFFTGNMKQLPPPSNCPSCDNYHSDITRDPGGSYCFEGGNRGSFEFIQVSDIVKKDFIDKLETLGIPYSECYSIRGDGSLSGRADSRYVIKTFINRCKLRSSISFKLLEQLEKSATRGMYEVKISDNIRQYFIQYAPISSYDNKGYFKWECHDIGWPPFDQYIRGEAPYGDVLIKGKIFYTLDEISKVNNITVSKPTTEEQQSHKTNNQYNYK